MGIFELYTSSHVFQYVHCLQDTALFGHLAPVYPPSSSRPFRTLFANNIQVILSTTAILGGVNLLRYGTIVLRRKESSLEPLLTQWELLNKFEGKMVVCQWYSSQILCHKKAVLFAVCYQHTHGQEGSQVILTIPSIWGPLLLATVSIVIG